MQTTMAYQRVAHHGDQEPDDSIRAGGHRAVRGVKHEVIGDRHQRERPQLLGDRRGVGQCDRSEECQVGRIGDKIEQRTGGGWSEGMNSFAIRSRRTRPPRRGTASRSGAGTSAWKMPARRKRRHRPIPMPANTGSRNPRRAMKIGTVFDDGHDDRNDRDDPQRDLVQLRHIIECVVTTASSDPGMGPAGAGACVP